MHHYGNPCLHCGTPHDEVPAGPCQGDRKQAVVLAYCVDRQAWQNPGSGCDTVLCMMSTGEIFQEAMHPTEWFMARQRFKNAETLNRREFRQRYRYTAP